MNVIAPVVTTANHNDTRVLSHKSLDELENRIISLSQHLNACEYEFLVSLREFDLRQGWKAYHFNNCAEWLNMKCGLSPRTAREKLRVGNALFDLPEVSRAFQKGDLSYSKARALARVATPKSEEDLLRFALKANAAQVDRHCYELRNANRKLSTTDANRAHSGRFMSYAPTGEGRVAITIELPEEQARLLRKAVDRAVAVTKDSDADYFEDGVDHAELEGIDEHSSREPSPLQQQQADAVVELARFYLAGGESRPSCSADHYQVVVHVDERALRADNFDAGNPGAEGQAGEANKPGQRSEPGGSREPLQCHGHNAATSACVPGEPCAYSKSDLPIETVRRLCRDGAIVPLVQDDAGNPAGLGRKHRVVNPQLRRALLARDRGCRFPGCTHDKWLDAHHVVHWAEGGETTADNLVILCSTHHRLVHEGGFEIKRGPDGAWQFKNASGFRTNVPEQGSAASCNQGTGAQSLRVPGVFRST